MTNPTTDREQRPVSGIRAVVLNDFGRLLITQGEEESLIVETDAQMLPNVQSEVIDGRLELGMNRSWSERVANSFTLRHVAYHLTVRQLESIELKGIANLEMHNYTGGKLEITSRGHITIRIDRLQLEKLTGSFHWASTVSISGSVREQEITLSGTSKYSAGNLVSQRAALSLLDESHAEMQVEQSLAIERSGDASVQYHGNPQISMRETGA